MEGRFVFFPFTGWMPAIVVTTSHTGTEQVANALSRALIIDPQSIDLLMMDVVVAETYYSVSTLPQLNT